MRVPCRSSLKGRFWLHVQPGQTKMVNLPLTKRDFSIWSEEVDGWVVVAGEFQVLVGSSSRDIRLHAQLTVNEAALRLKSDDEQTVVIHDRRVARDELV